MAETQDTEFGNGLVVSSADYCVGLQVWLDSEFVVDSEDGVHKRPLPKKENAECQVVFMAATLQDSPSLTGTSTNPSVLLPGFGPALFLGVGGSAGITQENIIHKREGCTWFSS